MPAISIAQKEARILRFDLDFGNQNVDLTGLDVIFVVGETRSPKIKKQMMVSDVNTVEVVLNETDTAKQLSLNYEIWVQFPSPGWVRQVRDKFIIEPGIDYAS